MVFTTNTDVTTRQFLFELGDRTTNGISIYMLSGQLYCSFHQNTSGGDGKQVPVWTATTVGGEIHEVQMTNTWPTGGVSDIQTLHTNLMNKW